MSASWEHSYLLIDEINNHFVRHVALGTVEFLDTDVDLLAHFSARWKANREWSNRELRIERKQQGDRGHDKLGAQS